MEKTTILFSILLTIAFQCTHLHNNQLYITSIPNEVVNIPLEKIFKNQNFEYLSFTPEQQQLSIVTPLSIHLKQKINGQDGQKVITFKFEKSSSNLTPIKKVALLGLYDKGYYAEHNSKQFTTLPVIDSLFGQLQKPGQKSECYDIVSIDKTYFADCSTDGEDYISSATQDQGITRIPAPAESTKRKLDQIDNYIYRSSVSKIELFKFENNLLTLLTTIDTQKMKTLLGKDDFTLQVIDFQTYTNGQVSILNTSGELILLEYKNDDFVLIKNIDTKATKLVSYDYDVYSNSYVVVTDSLIKYVNSGGETFLDIIVSTAYDKVYLTKNYIVYSVLNQVKVYNQNLKLMYTTTLSKLQCQLFAQINSDGFIYADDNYFYYYQIQDKSYLRFQKNSQDVDYLQATLKQASSPSCELSIFYKVVTQNSFEIYKQQDEGAVLIDSYYCLDEQVFKFKPVFQGPRLSYKFDALDIKIETFDTKVAEIKNADDQGNLVFRKVLPLSEKVFYLITQNDQLEIFGQSCLINDALEIVQITCENVFQKLIGPKFQESNLQVWWSDDNTVYFARAVDANIEIYYLNKDKKEFASLTQFTLEENIRSIKSDSQLLYVLTETATQAYTITIADKQKLVLTLAPADGIQASQIKLLYLFQITGTSIELYQLNLFRKNFLLSIAKTKAVNIQIYENHFVVLSEDLSANVYNYKDPQNIYVEKLLGFYDYQNVDISSATSDFTSNLLYIKAQYGTDNVFLVYNIEQSHVNTLFTQIKTLAQSITASNNLLLLTGTENLQQNYQITGDYYTKSKFQSTTQQPAYTTQRGMQSSVFNGQVTKTLQNLNLTVVNRGNELFQTNQNVTLTYSKDDQPIHCVDVGQSWYSGQVLELGLKNKSTNVEFKQSITKLNETLEFSPFISEFDEKTLIQLNNDKITLVQKDNFTTHESKLDSNYQYTNLLLVYNSLIFVEARKKESTNYELIVIKCENNTCTAIAGSLTFKTRLRRGFIDKNFFFILIGTQITAYETKGDFTKLSEFEQIKRITTFSGSYISYIEYNPLKDNIYQFIIIDTQGYLEFITYEISKTSQENVFILYQPSQIIQRSQQYYPQGQTASGLYYQKDKNQLIVSFTSSAAYAFEVVIDCSKNKLCDITKFGFLRAYQQYGNSYISNEHTSSYMNENILSQVYLVEDHYEVLLFDTSDSKEKSSIPKLAIGGLKAPKFPQNQHYQMQSFVYKYNNNLYLLSSAENKDKLYHYQLLRSSQFCIKTDKIQEELELSLTNNFNQIDLPLKLTIQEYSPPDDDDKKGFPVWAIVLISIGVAAILGFALYKYCAGKKKKVEDSKYLLGH